MSRREATTLIEVLVAIFVMAIGMIALLALFPLGAFQMADAIKDDRVSAVVANATSIATAWNLRHDAAVTTILNRAVPNPNGPSYSAYVDPVGFSNYLPGSFWQNYIAGVNGGIPRCTTSFVGLNSVSALQWCTFLDDINFANNGIPNPPAGTPSPPLSTSTTVERAYGYSWAWLLRRPKNSVPSLVEMWVVVYQQRPLGLNGMTLGGSETTYTGVANGNVVTLSTPAGPPSLRAGSWILDCTPAPAAATPGNARFYRVVGVTDNGATMDVEVDNPVLATMAVPSQFAVMDGVAEVIYKGTNWLP